MMFSVSCVSQKKTEVQYHLISVGSFPGQIGENE